MPGEVIDRPNPQPLASHIPDDVLELGVKLEMVKLSNADLQGLEEFRRASNYIAAGKRLPLFWISSFSMHHFMPKLFADRTSYDFSP